MATKSKIQKKKYDVFLSFNSEDREAVEKLAIYLADGALLPPWFDQWELIPGEPWVRNLERGLNAAATCAVFVGKSGEGPWQKREVEGALQQQVTNREFRVIPVLLPGAPCQPVLPPFLAGNMWVDFRDGLNNDETLWRLECGIRGVAPGRGRPTSQEAHRISLESADVLQDNLTGSLKQLQQHQEVLQQRLRQLKAINVLENDQVEKNQYASLIAKLNAQQEKIERQISELAKNLVAESYEQCKRQQHVSPEATYIFVCYRHSQPDSSLAHILAIELEQAGHQVFVDTDIRWGADWVRKIRTEIHKADYMLLLLSRAALTSEMVIEEVRMAYERAQERGDGFPRILPIRVQFPLSEALPYRLSLYLRDVPQIAWNEPDDTAPLVQQLVTTIAERSHLPVPEIMPSTAPVREKLTRPRPYVDPRDLTTPGEAIDVESRFYISREADQNVFAAIERPRALVTLRGSRQTGKTSLLMRVNDAIRREQTLQTVFIDFEIFPHKHFRELNNIWRAIIGQVARQLQITEWDSTSWDPKVDYDENITRFLNRFGFQNSSKPLLLCFDKVEQVFETPVQSAFFASLRAFYNRGALEPLWKNVRWILVTSTEPQFFIKDLNESPFNVGRKVRLHPFQRAEVAAFARRHGLTLASWQVDEIMRYLGGHPYLVHLLLYRLVHHPQAWDVLFDTERAASTVFRDHLHRYLFQFQQEDVLAEAMKGFLNGQGCDDARLASRLEGAGLVRRNQQQKLVPLCDLYKEFFSTQLR